MGETVKLAALSLAILLLGGPLPAPQLRCYFTPTPPGRTESLGTVDCTADGAHWSSRRIYRQLST
jgi:hypothetical protein